MEERKYTQPELDDSVYGTGRTQPPKSNGGLVAMLLILIIFLCGVITVMGVLNVRLFQKLQLREENDLSISFTAGAQEGTEPWETQGLPSPAAQEDSALGGRISLHQSPQGTDSLPEPQGMSLQDIYTKTIPSVVSISSTGHGTASTGTGVIFTSDGYLITNAHVVENALSITVQLTDGRILAAEAVSADKASDLAVLRIPANDLIPVQFGDSASLRVGDTVVAIGDPLGVKFRGTYTDGIVSAINRDVEVQGQTMTLIQTNAALNSGNSGGPLINCYGQVIGINTMKISALADSGDIEGLGFAIPSATVRDIVNQLLAQGYVSGRPTLGITGEALTPFYQSYYRWPAGLYITQVDPDTDAFRKGIEAGDILTSIGEHRVTTMADMKQALRGLKIGDRVTAVIYRSGKHQEIQLTLTEDKG